ncbi:MAG TPA: 16S rRNA (guanine(527)-N(7))-methyltransferase RsmG [Mycobacteriales bacterium]
MSTVDTEPAVPEQAAAVFGAAVDRAVAYARLLATDGTVRGLIGPREVPRLWDRHLLNSAAIAALVPADARVVDVGSGAGLPGIPLALVRPDLTIALLEPLARRVTFLDECVDRLGLANVTVVRGRAEEGPVRRSLGGADVVTARAVAPLDKLAGWCLPLLRPGGLLLALKGSTAAEELAAAGPLPGAADATVTEVGDPPATVVMVTRAAPTRSTVRATARGGRAR